MHKNTQEKPFLQHRDQEFGGTIITSKRMGPLHTILFGLSFIGGGVFFVWLLFLAPLEWEPKRPSLEFVVLPLTFVVIGVLVIVYECMHLQIKRKEEMKKALARELEDQLTELKEQLSLGHITQEEYEQKRKRLLAHMHAWVSLLAIFYGLYGLLLLSVFLFRFISRAPLGPTIGPGIIIFFILYIILLVSASLNLSVTCGLLLAKSWARNLGITISGLGLPFLALGGLSFSVNLITDFFLAGVLGYLMYLLDFGVFILNIAAIFYLKRPEMKTYFEKKRVSEREIVELSPRMNMLFRVGYYLGILNLFMGLSLIIAYIVGVVVYVLYLIAYFIFAAYWGFWYIPFFASLTINIYGCWKKQALSKMGLLLTLIGISVLLFFYVVMGGRLPGLPD